MTNGEVVQWLESPEGEQWSSMVHTRLYYFISIKDDTDSVPYDGFLWYA